MKNLIFGVIFTLVGFAFNTNVEAHCGVVSRVVTRSAQVVNTLRPVRRIVSRSRQVVSKVKSRVASRVKARRSRNCR